MFYRINIALNGRHFFATADHSITDADKELAVWTTLNEKFPASEGYSLTSTRFDTAGTPIRYSAGA